MVHESNISGVDVQAPLNPDAQALSLGSCLFPPMLQFPYRLCSQARPPQMVIGTVSSSSGYTNYQSSNPSRKKMRLSHSSSQSLLVLISLTWFTYLLLNQSLRPKGGTILHGHTQIVFPPLKGREQSTSPETQALRGVILQRRTKMLMPEKREVSIRQTSKKPTTEC